MKNNRLAITVTKAEEEMIRKLASEKNLTVSKLIINLCKQNSSNMTDASSAVQIQEVINIAYDLITNSSGLINKINSDPDTSEKLKTLRKLRDESWEF
ncbi:MAG: hypothetical protein IJL67_13055 [Oscillospiraceae bacterium]|nr:hypothetical protein [Oscillospiraceae bacterium]